MSRHKRHGQKQVESRQIEWLKYRTGYPLPEEREEIIHLRQELSIELIKLTLIGVKPESAEVRALTRKYGAGEVILATQKFQETMESPSLIGDDAKSYREYRQRYARFGAGLKFYTQREVDELFDTHKSTFIESDGETIFGEVDKLLLFGWRDWEDITPPAIPPRPDDFHAPQPAVYSREDQ